MTPSRNDVTTLLRLAGSGDAQAQEALFRLVEGELRHRAHARLRQERPTHHLQTTLLVDEAFLKLVGSDNPCWEDRSQFYRCAARVMRQILVDHARERSATKRGGGDKAVSLEQAGPLADRKALDPATLLALHEALTKLATTHPELSQIVELHHFGGWDLKDVATEILHVPYSVVKRQWRMAKALLHREMCGGDDDAGVSPTH